MWKTAAAAAAGAAAACLARSEYEKKALSVESLSLVSGRLEASRTFVFLSDLHSNEFGRDNCRLLEAIDDIAPDAVLSGGDMMITKDGQADLRVPLQLFRQLAGKYPVYCGNGNHENRMLWRKDIYGSKYRHYKEALRSMGVVCLEDDSAWFGSDIRITGLDVDRRFYRKALFYKLPPMTEEYLENKIGKKPAYEGMKPYFQILLAHSPLYFDSYAGWGADLTLCGHFHGGTIRLPFLGGVMTPQYQFFLPCCAGSFQRGESVMAVSRGLGTHSINIRLNNRPQLMVLELKPAGTQG